MVLVMLERVAGDQLPGFPLLRHVLKAVRVIQVLLAQRLYCFKESRVGLLRPFLAEGLAYPVHI
jgi:hypothetical protein